MSSNIEQLTVGGGCFWCLEAVFQQVPGVVAVQSGYAAGATQRPRYEQVCGGQTGHAEVVRIEFDPAQVSADVLLDIFWCIHDPTTLNRQGADTGTQYRSIILFADERQKQIAEQSLAEADKLFADPIVTEVQPLEKFWPAEDYHQDYYRNNPMQPYCQMVVEPKVSKFRQRYADLLNN